MAVNDGYYIPIAVAQAALAPYMVMGDWVGASCVVCLIMDQSRLSRKYRMSTMRKPLAPMDRVAVHDHSSRPSEWVQLRISATNAFRP